MNPKWRFSFRAAGLKTSATLQINSKAQALKKEGIDVLNFSAGEPDFPTPPLIAEAGIRAIQSGKTRYTPASGIPELREAVARKLREENHLNYTSQQVMITNGTKQALHNALQVLVSPGDEVLVLSPFWVSYTELIHLSGGKSILIPTTEDARPIPSKIARAIGPETVGIIVNSPNNPAGVVYTKEEIAGIAQAAVDHGLWILSDEVYEKLIYGGAKHISPANISEEAKERTILVSAVSKTYAMTGWRIGYLAGPSEVVSLANKIQEHSTGNPNTPAQWAAVQAFQESGKTVSEMVEEYDRRRVTIVDALNKIPGIQCPMPQGAFYSFPNVSKLLLRRFRGVRLETSLKLAELLLEEAHMATVPGSAFGTEGYLRFSFATSMEQIEEGLERLKKFVQNLD